MLRRRSLLAALPAAAALASAWDARAQQILPSLNMFIPAAPGGGWDGLGRAMEVVARQAGLVGSMQFENVGGAGGMVGLPRFISQRRGRGDSLMVGGSVMVGAALTNKAPYGLKDVTPIAKLTGEAAIIVVPANSSFGNIGQLAEALKSDPRGTSVAGGSAGGTDHIVLGLILKALGRSAKDASFVAFAGGGPAQAAILGGQVKAGISGYSEFAEQIKSGRIKALASSGETRLEPSIPTLKESGIDVVASNWRGVFGAPGIDAAARGKLVQFVTALHDLPAWKELLQTRGWDDEFLSGEAFDKYVRDDNAATEGVLKEIGLA
ncbi:Bug family tripartite tricarboxylate transporter substrate binding protein [Roseomonas sp. BN140053]|uniref:Bug family tripartite tricarboxylate transporter substrate binding protein n=1 Tax=Roseomonas sp. BN140053 TaxID=3391898 RepID=UPI0039EA5ED1